MQVVLFSHAKLVLSCAFGADLDLDSVGVTPYIGLLKSSPLILVALNHCGVNFTDFVHCVFLALSTATATKSSLFFFVSPLLNAAECEMCFIGKMDEPALDFLGFMASGKDCLRPFCKRTYFTVL